MNEGGIRHVSISDDASIIPRRGDYYRNGAEYVVAQERRFSDPVRSVGSQLRR